MGAVASQIVVQRGPLVPLESTFSPVFTAKIEKRNGVIPKRGKQTPGLGCRLSSGITEVSVAFVTSRK